MSIGIKLLFMSEKLLTSKTILYELSFNFFLLIILCPLFLLAFPTILSINFGNENFVIKYIVGHKSKTINYSDVQWVKKSGIWPGNYQLGIKEEKERLILQYFDKNDRATIINNIQEITARI